MKTKKHNFIKLCEGYGVYKSIKREFYPKQIDFSPEFLSSLKEEFLRQQINEDIGKINNHRNKFVKALNFHLRDLERSTIFNEDIKRHKLSKEQKNVLKRNFKPACEK
jgi:hypothetical protein